MVRRPEKAGCGFDPLLMTDGGTRSKHDTTANSSVLLRYSREGESWISPFIMAGVSMVCQPVLVLSCQLILVPLCRAASLLTGG